MRRHPLMLALALVLGFAAVVAAAARPAPFGAQSEDTSSAAALPTACDNFVHAAQLLARQGSSASVQISGGNVWANDADRYQTLKALLDACDAELAASIPH